MAEDTLLAARREVAQSVSAEIVAGYRREGFSESILERLAAAAEARVLSRSGLLAPLLDAYERELAMVTRERDDLARWKRWRLVADTMALTMDDLDETLGAANDARREAFYGYGKLLRATRTAGHERLDVEVRLMGETAARIGMRVADYSAVERGKSPPFPDDVTRRLCSWFGCDPQPLLDAAARAEKVLRGE